MKLFYWEVRCFGAILESEIGNVISRGFEGLNEKPMMIIELIYKYNGIANILVHKS